MDAEALTSPSASLTRWAALVEPADTDAVAAISRTRFDADVLDADAATIDAVNLTRVDAATVALTVITVLATTFVAPSTPKALAP